MGFTVSLSARRMGLNFARLFPRFFKGAAPMLIAARMLRSSALAIALATLGTAYFCSSGLAQDKPFAHKGVAADAERYETFLKTQWKPGSRPAAELRQAGDKAMSSDPRAASRHYAAAVSANDKDALAWLGLARALLAIKPDTTQTSERYDLPVNASGSALRAYERSTDKATKAASLAALADALARRSYWRPALEAFNGSLTLVDDRDVREAYDKLRNEHGFRMIDYKTESETANPRVCLQFSEPLARSTSTDFTKFVSVDGKDPQTITPEGKQLCLDGLTFGQRYQVQLRSGLPSDVGETLTKPVEIAVYVPDRKPLARVTGRSYVLPSRGQQGIPVVSVNTSRVGIEVYRVGDRALAGTVQGGDMQRQVTSYEIEQIREKTGAKVYEGELEVANKRNEDVTTAFPVSEAIGTLKPGAYLMVAHAKGEGKTEERQPATQWFIVSDLGLTAFTGSDGVHGFVRSLADAAPVTGAKLRLIARNNEVLGTATADANGYVHFDQGLARGEGGAQPALLVAEKDGADYAFLDLAAAGFDLSDRGVKGRDAAGPLDAFLYADRGVYRPGEDVHFAALVRDKAGTAAPLPVTLVISRPDGVEHKRITLLDGGLGGRATTLALGGGVMTGTWRAKLYADPKAEPLNQLAFLVEDFVPERIDMTLEPQAKTIAVEEPVTIKATGRYLYGPPAQNLALEGDIVVKLATKDAEGLAGYKFGLSDEKVEPVRAALEGLGSTDATGVATLNVNLPAIPKTTRPLEAEMLIRLRETGGKTIERSVTLPIDAKRERIGIKPMFASSGVGEGEQANFEVIALDATGKKATLAGAHWQLSRLETNWQWYSRDGNWGYEPATTVYKIETGTVGGSAKPGATTESASEAEAAVRLTMKPTPGRYRLEIISADGRAVSSLLFNSGWVANGEVADSPEVLETALDKTSYKPGDIAKLKIASKLGGTALVTVLNNGVLSSQDVQVPKGGTEVAIPVASTWGPGAYATAILYRGMDEKAKRMPSRAIGVKWLAIDRSGDTLKVAMPVEAKVKSGATLKVPVQISGLAPGEEARVTVAAVDIGILNLTRYQSPNPEGWFHAQRKLGLEIRDYYGRLIDGMRADRGKLRSGGDGTMGMALTAAPPSVETILSQFSGIVVVDKDGAATIEFQLPDFNGSVRLMAVAWSKEKIGHGQTDLIVRDRVALTASAPRFLTLGDDANLDVAIHNVEGVAGDYKLAVNVSTDAASPEDGPGTAQPERSVALAVGERKSLSVALKPTDVGTKTYSLTVTGPLTSGGEPINVKRQLTFNVVPPAGDIKRTTVSQIAPHGKLTLSPDMVADLIASRTKLNLSVGPQASLDVPGLLSALDRYPHGCAEQTVSRAMPLLYANTVAATLGMATDAKLRARVQSAIERVFEMQDGSGAFGLWGPTNADIWITAYVTDFLTRAKEVGYTVNPRSFGQALDKLSNFVAYAKDLEKGGENRAYALYVLARNGRAPIGELRYYADTKLAAFATPLAKAQLGAALSMMGDKERAEKTFAAAIVSLTDKTLPIWRQDYGSTLRDHAALVTLSAETGNAKADAPTLVNVIAKSYAAKSYTSTQEQAWMLLAANALGDQGKSLALTVNGKLTMGSLQRQLSPADLTKDGGFTIANETDTPTDAIVSIVGSALTPEPAIAKGFKIERTYYTLDGKKVDLASATGGQSNVTQNDRFVAVVTIEAKEPGGRVILVDRLPAGFEIENPRLAEGGTTKGLEWLKTGAKPEHTEFRDDRFVAAFNFFAKGAGGAAHDGDATEESEGESGGERDVADKKPAGPVTTATVAYIVRAVNPGSFVHPAATVEDMYRPERHARTASGRLTVTVK
jgi:alpha-2-macroglobulin